MKHWPAVLTLAVLVLAPRLEFEAANMRNIDYGKLLGIAGKVVQATTPISDDREVAIGREIAARLLGATPLADDEALQRYVNRVGIWLAQQTERPDLPWRFGVLDTDTVNAFAAPGGYIFITRGLVLRMSDEAELAGVLAHEISHVLHHHHLNALRKQAAAGIAVDIASMAMETKINLDAIAKLGMQLYARGLERGDEYQADRVGVVVAARGGYDPYGLPHMLSKIASAPADDVDFTLMFSTHPPTGDRLTRLAELMEPRFARHQAGNRPLRVHATAPTSSDERQEDSSQPATTAGRRPKPAAEPSVRANRSLVTEIQQLLNHLDYDAGEADGIYGNRTRDAIESFQRDMRVPIDADPSHALLALLRDQASKTPSAASTPATQPRRASASRAGPNAPARPAVAVQREESKSTQQRSTSKPIQTARSRDPSTTPRSGLCLSGICMGNSFENVASRNEKFPTIKIYDSRHRNVPASDPKAKYLASLFVGISARDAAYLFHRRASAMNYLIANRYGDYGAPISYGASINANDARLQRILRRTRVFCGTVFLRLSSTKGANMQVYFRPISIPGSEFQPLVVTEIHKSYELSWNQIDEWRSKVRQRFPQAINAKNRERTHTAEVIFSQPEPNSAGISNAALVLRDLRFAGFDRAEGSRYKQYRANLYKHPDCPRKSGAVSLD